MIFFLYNTFECYLILFRLVLNILRKKNVLFENVKFIGGYLFFNFDFFVEGRGKGKSEVLV